MATKVSAESFDRYLGEARSWETDRLLSAERSKKRAWAAAILAGGIAFVAVIALAGLTPLKQTELKVIRVDNATGNVDVVTEIPNSKTNYSEAVNKYFAQLYIRYREGYSRELAEEYYSHVGIMSASAEQRRYGDFFTPKNPLSPLNVYGFAARVKVRIKSVSFIKENVALVRYTKEVERSPSERPTISHWAATVVFRYSGAPLSEADRAVNPLGFQVMEYRNDPDAAISEPATVAVTQAPSIGSAAAGVMVFPGVEALPVPDQVPAVAPAASGKQ